MRYNLLYPTILLPDYLLSDAKLAGKTIVCYTWGRIIA